MRARTALLTAVLWSATACDATFTDFRPPAVRGGDAGDAPDSGVDPPDGEGLIRVLATGTFEGRAGHNAEGHVSLVELPGGSRELRFADDFSSSGAPGPIVLLSGRESLGTEVDPALDLNLGTHKSTRGAQSYPVPVSDDMRRIAWIYCVPYGVEIARAIMMEEE